MTIAMSSGTDPLEQNDTPETLCDQCSHIDIDGISSRAFKVPIVDSFRRFHTIDDTQWTSDPEKLNNCSLCRLFASVRVCFTEPSRYRLCRFAYRWEEFRVLCRDQSLHNGLFLLGIISEDMLSRVDRHKLEIKLDSAQLICQVRPSAAAYSPSPRLY
jgi:hypothetical protein